MEDKDDTHVDMDGDMDMDMDMATSMDWTWTGHGHGQDMDMDTDACLCGNTGSYDFLVLIVRFLKKIECELRQISCPLSGSQPNPCGSMHNLVWFVT